MCPLTRKARSPRLLPPRPQRILRIQLWFLDLSILTAIPAILRARPRSGLLLTLNISAHIVRGILVLFLLVIARNITLFNLSIVLDHRAQISVANQTQMSLLVSWLTKRANRIEWVGSIGDNTTSTRIARRSRHPRLYGGVPAPIEMHVISTQHTSARHSHSPGPSLGYRPLASVTSFSV